MRRNVVAALTVSAVAQAAFGIAVPQGDNARWELVSAALDVRANTDSSLTLVGTLRLRLAAGSSLGPTLVIGGLGLAFDSLRGPPGAQITVSGERDTARVTLRAASRASEEVVLRAWWRAPSRVGRQIAVGRDGAFASWGAIWYPVPAWPAGEQPNLLVAGTTRISIPLEWRSLSNGRLVDTRTSTGVRTDTWHSRQPVAWSFIAGPYLVSWHHVGEVRVGVFLLPGHADRSAGYASAIPRFVRLLADRFGPYPFETFGIAELPRSLAPPGFGGRSEQGYFIAHTDALEGPGVNLPLFAHELAHMWFPNLVDSRPPGDDMMDEAIANYAVALVLEATTGDSSAIAELVEGNPDFSLRAYFQYGRLGTDEPLMADYSPFIARAKGPMVYRMLRKRVGDEVFFGTLRDFARRYARRSASLADLRQSFLDAAPRDSGLTQFFAEWLDRPGAPVLDVSWEPWGTATRPQVRVRVAQHQQLYHLRLALVVKGAGDAVSHTVPVDDSAQVFVLDSPSNPSDVALDPGHQLLLWRSEFGPPSASEASSWSLDRWRSWFDTQVRWLMGRYGVESTTVDVADRSVAVWHGNYGGHAQESDLASCQALLDLLSRVGRPDSLRLSWGSGRDSVLLVAGISEAGQAVRIVARGGWGGRQMAIHLAQEVAIRYRWRWIPR